MAVITLNFVWFFGKSYTKQVMKHLMRNAFFSLNRSVFKVQHCMACSSADFYIFDVLSCTTRAVRARWVQPTTPRPWWTPACGFAGSGVYGWPTPPSCPSCPPDTPWRPPTWSARRRPTWSNKTGASSADHEAWSPLQSIWNNFRKVGHVLLKLKLIY